MKAKYDSIITNNTWDLVDTQKKVKVIGIKWIYKLNFKSDGNLDMHKAWLVVKGHAQSEGLDFDETFAPTTEMVTIRTIIAMAAHYKWPIY